MHFHRFIALIVLVLAVMLLPMGCNGVQMNAQYSQKLDRATALADETATRAEAGQLTPAQMTKALRGEATVFQDFKDAKDGKPSRIPATTQPSVP